MMSAQQLQYYSWLERERKKAMYNYSLAGYYYNMIKNAMIKGCIPTEDPDLSGKFLYLIDEYGIQLFEDELSACHLIYEDGKMKYDENYVANG